MEKIKSLGELIVSGFDEDALENDKYLYVWPKRPNKDDFDSHLYKYDKTEKTLEWIPGFISIVGEIDDAKDVKIDERYLKQYL